LYRTEFKIQKGEKFEEKLLKQHYDDIKAFYTKKTQQAHIMNELALWISRGQSINTFVDDYFNLDYEAKFLPTYFKNRLGEISNSISKAKHEQIYKDLSEKQKEILASKENLLIIA
jgi:hypothetical protein